MMMVTIKKAPPFSFWEKVLAILGIIGILLVILTLPPFNMPRSYHLLVGAVGVVLAIWGAIGWKHPFGPTGVLIGSVAAAICYGVYAGYIVR